MDNDNRVEEWRRLRDHYAELTQEELQAIANEAYELTDLAKQALQGELQRRGLPIRLAEAEPESASEVEAAPSEDSDPSELDLVLVRRVCDRDEAQKIMAVLHGSGVPCYLGPENVEDVDSFHGSFEGGVDLKILRAQIQGVNALLSRTLPADPTDEDENEAAACCPKCHSSEIVFQGLDEPVPDGSTATSKFNWSCDSCGYQWKDDGVEAEA